MEKEELQTIDQSKFEFIQRDETIFDQKFETKKIGFLQDALIRFSKNKGSVVAFVILCLLILFSIFTPMFSKYEVNVYDMKYRDVLPKAFEAGTGFWDGTKKVTENEQKYDYFHAIGAASDEISREEYTSRDGIHVVNVTYIFDSYEIGYYFKDFKQSEFQEIWEHDQTCAEEDRILYPLVDENWIQNIPVDHPVLSKPSDKNNPMSPTYRELIQNAEGALLNLYANDANYFFAVDNKKRAIYDDNGDLVTLYKTASASDVYKDEDGYLLAEPNGGVMATRVLYKNYYKYLHGSIPKFLFGTDGSGRDLLVNIAAGGRLSLALGFGVSLINIILGIIYGAIEGYYGGVTDLVMERIVEVLSEVPFMIVATLFQLHLAEKVGALPSLLFAFVLTGWIGTAGRTRMQFYRYKGQEYVLAARTLGAKDSRLIAKHILPNAVGPIITSSVLMVPGVIFSESMLSYLGIIDFGAANITSIGLILNRASKNWNNYPHQLFFPALFVSLLMICFNIFGNGLRDAFNPSLRGVDE